MYFNFKKIFFIRYKINTTKQRQHHIRPKDTIFPSYYKINAHLCQIIFFTYSLFTYSLMGDKSGHLKLNKKIFFIILNL